MYKFYITLIGLFQVTTLFAQQISNIHITQEVDNVVIIYDLTGGQPGETFTIEVTVSNNNGQSFLIMPKSLTGDLMDVTAGNNKKIIWDVFKDRDELTGDGFVFKLNAKSNNPASNFSANSGSFTDKRDGEVYKWVQIGTQIWMAENLKATKYNDGTDISNITDNTKWKKLKTGAYCFYENDIVNKPNYGALYNAYAANTGKLCPIGWHVPSDSEWTTLIDYLGGEDVAGGKLKETGTTHWLSPNIGASNTSRFSALPGGFRYLNKGTFHYIGEFGHWWSSTENSTDTNWHRDLYYNFNHVFRFNYNKKYGFSVRCVKDY